MAGGGSSTQSSMGQQTSSSHSEVVIPPELKPLYTQSAQGMQNLQNLAPLWGSQETVLNQGAVPTRINYNYIPGTPAPDQPTYYQDSSGKMYTADKLAPPTWSGDPTHLINTPDGQIQVYPIPSTPGVATPGRYDYANPIFQYNPEDYTTKQTSPNYLEANPMKVAGADPLQTWAAENVKSLVNTPQGEQTASLYGTLAPLLAGRMATGAGAATDPAVLAAGDAFDKLMAPLIENQMGLAGLGKSSSLANSLALGKSSQLAPLIQDYITREQATMTNQANMYASLMPQFSALGGAETTRLLNALNDAAQIGGVQRGITQEPLTAEYQDYLRRQALAEQALFVPFGATAGPSIGPVSSSESQGTTSGTGKMSQGMFK